MKRGYILTLLVVMLLTGCMKVSNQEERSCITGEVNVGTECIYQTFGVNFETDSETQIQSIVVKYGEMLPLPEIPIKYGFTFDGWYIDDMLQSLFDIEQPITEALTLHAKWNMELFMEIEMFLLEEQFNGSFLLNIDGGDVQSKGYGLADKDQLINNSPNTIFHIGSITKQFTAAAILILEEQGLLSVDDPVSQYIEGIPNGDEITIHHLLMQSSGLNEYTNEIDWSDTEYLSSPKSPETLIQLINDKASLFNPGYQFNYCNTNYLLLGLIIEVVSELTYEEFISQNIFDPLNMSNSEFNVMDSDLRYAIGYEELTENISTESIKVDSSISYAAGAITSTTIDLFKWHLALKENTILSKESTDKMFEHYINAGYGGYGYGWVILEDGEYPVMEHGGFINGFRGYIYRNLESDTALIFLTNVEINNIYIIADEIIEMMNKE